MANSKVSSVRVRSVKRHFLGVFCFIKLMPRQKLSCDMEYKDPRNGVCQGKANDCKKL